MDGERPSRRHRARGVDRRREKTWADLAHFVSQVLFIGGLVGLLWLASTFPHGRPRRDVWRLVAVGAGLAVAGPLIGGYSGSTPPVFQPDGTPAERGPIADVLPASVATLAAVPLMAVPAAALVVFVVRLVRADRATRAVMAWPVVALGFVVLLIIAGAALGDTFPAAGEVAFLVAAPLVPFAFAFGPVRRRLQRLSTDLADRVAELEESRARLATATEAERQRLERDLHDGAQQEILALMAHLEVARGAADAADRDHALDRVAELSRGAYDRVRQIAHGIRPAELDDLGRAEAIRSIADRTPLPVRLQLDRTVPGQYPPAIEGAALMFVSEAVANVLKHAAAPTLTISLRSGTDLRVGVSDDGVGGADPRGGGIRGLRDRVEAAGGWLTIESAPGGTHLFATFPGAGTRG